MQLLSRPRNPGVRVSFSNGLLFRLSTKDPASLAKEKRSSMEMEYIYVYVYR